MMGLMSRVGLIGLVVGLAGLAVPTDVADRPKPIVYTVRFPTPDKHIAEVVATIPTGQRPTVELMMAVWSPGFYRVEDYARNVHDLSAIGPRTVRSSSSSRRRTDGSSATRAAGRRSPCPIVSPAIAGPSHRTG